MTERAENTDPLLLVRGKQVAETWDQFKDRVVAQFRGAGLLHDAASQQGLKLGVPAQLARRNGRACERVST